MATTRLLKAAAGVAAAVALLLSPAPALAQAQALPADVANKMFSAWVAKDRKAAARYGTPAAVSSLFSYRPRPPDEFRGCRGGACWFEHTSVRVPGGLNGILMIVKGNKVTKVYRSRFYAKPENAAKHLYAAYRANDRWAALEVASHYAVHKLFWISPDPRAVPYRFMGCSPTAGGKNCSYYYEGGAMLMYVRGNGAGGHYVETINYIAD